jgi:hypothetical protein
LISTCLEEVEFIEMVDCAEVAFIDFALEGLFEELI